MMVCFPAKVTADLQLLLQPRNGECWTITSTDGVKINNVLYSCDKVNNCEGDISQIWPGCTREHVLECGDQEVYDIVSGTCQKHKSELEEEGDTTNERISEFCQKTGKAEFSDIYSRNVVMWPIKVRQYDEGLAFELDSTVLCYKCDTVEMDYSKAEVISKDSIRVVFSGINFTLPFYINTTEGAYIVCEDTPEPTVRLTDEAANGVDHYDFSRLYFVGILCMELLLLNLNY